MKDKELLQFKAEDVIRVSKNGIIFLGGIKLSPTEVENLKSEVKYFKTLRLHSIFLETVREQARLTMFEKAQNFEDMRSGKGILYALGVFENILNTVEKTGEQKLTIKKHGKV